MNKKIVSITAVCLIAAAGVGYTFLKPSEPQLNFASEPVQRGNIEDTVLANGMLQASKLVSVGAQVSGQIDELPVKLGDEVKEGDLVAQIDSLTQQNSLKDAQASLGSLQAQYEAKQAQIKQATYEYKRQKNMLSAKASSRTDYETAEANLAVYKAELKQLDAEIDQAIISVDNAKLDLGYTTIKAPMSGTVVYTAVAEGQTVNSNQTTPTIIEMANLDVMTVKAQISEADVINVHPGQKVYFTILGRPNKRYEATLKAIEPGPTLMDGDDNDLEVSDDEAVYYYGLFDVENPNRELRIGMTAQVSIILNKADNALIVPAQVLIRTPKGYQVPVLKNGQIEHRDVKVGINNKVSAEITSGLNDGDEVVLGETKAGSGDSSRRRGPPMGF
ncbi:membrane fusion protein, macrolide-specific efflux system [Vibrio xiamenensis]|uniref:Membrane fusion protein, macrolide-specific efflux system n=1 Tax=Vibrio xiamenensis TaxID=861298 RepID=A0A1G7ZR33_9VIBR|nr:efflux RND transporter periplasmic adaptor subunit [Vibrio xiamenensis]SDH10580.1 membrane fusion protein, macrolide-specific efflux system [Vibrio xiamenensis]